MRKLFVLSAVAALAVSGAAMAEGLNYSYVQADLLASKLKAGGGSENGSGFAGEASYQLGAPLFLSGGFGSDKFSNNGLTIKVLPLDLGLGVHLPLGSMVDFVGRASYERVKLKATGVGSESFSGWGLAAGVRGQVQSFEWNAGLKYRDVGDLQSIVGISVGGRYFFTPALALGLDLSSQKYDNDTLDVKEQIASLNFRYAFGSN